MFAQYKAYIICAVLFAALSGSFFFGRHVEGLENAQALEKQRVEMQAKIDTETDRRNEISARFEQKLDNIKIVNTTINNTVRHELEKQIYTECKLPDSGVQLINDNADKLNAVRKGKTP